MREQQRAEEAAVRAAVEGAAIRRLDEEAAAVRRMNLRPAAIAASLAEIERERQEIFARASGKSAQHESRAERLLARLPEIIEEYEKQVQQAVKVLAKPELVAEASEAVRRLLADGRITLAPNADRRRAGTFQGAGRSRLAAGRLAT